jgi:endonuclease/exonuclease/phosphatase family metal-dependent hydrolase
MRVWLLQLNMFHGKYLAELIRFLKKNQFDIIMLQEVSGGKLTQNKVKNTFQTLQKKLEYQGVLGIDWTLPGDNKDYNGNAIFCKKSIDIQGGEKVWLRKSRGTKNTGSGALKSISNPRSVLSVNAQINGKPLKFITTHLVRGPDNLDTKYKLNQTKKLYKYLKTVKIPFILTGDFNVTPNTKLIKNLDKLGANLTRKYKLKNTLNHRVHYARHLFPPGIAVDYIYTHPKIRVKKFRLIDKPTLSDHFGLALEFEI